MAYPQVYPRAVIDTIEDLTPGSLRSRASSIVTTTTKFSLETLSQDDQSSIGNRWERARSGHNDRPRSRLSMSSIAHPAPPYSEAVESTLLLPSHQNGDFQLQQQFLAPLADRPLGAVSVNEALPPSPVSSGVATPSIQSPIDDPDENPRARAAYYSNVVRTLDQNYTAAIERLRQEHAQAIATTRYDIDQAYRTQWKEKNREIERIREEAALAKDREVDQIRVENEARVKALEERVKELANELNGQKQSQDAAIEKARHEIEDLWERRWRDRIKIEREEKARSETDWESRMEASVNAETEKWIAFLKERETQIAGVVRRSISERHPLTGDWEARPRESNDLLERLLYVLDTHSFQTLNYATDFENLELGSSIGDSTSLVRSPALKSLSNHRTRLLPAPLRSVAVKDLSSVPLPL
ncbi:MAG: hypothetical protein Q9201_001554 [Fulgogasparrea decipioides]